MFASDYGHKEIVKILLEQEGIDINAEDIELYYSKFISMNWYFKIIFGIIPNYYLQLLCMHLVMVT